MCGLAGVVSSHLVQREIFHFQSLMTLAMFRGRYGAGVAVVPQNFRQKDVQILKTLGTADELVHTVDFDKATEKNPTAIIGHARYPTTGGDELDDSHPHVAGHIIGVHNGTMDRVNGFYVGKKDNDSKMLFSEIAEHGIERVMQNSDGDYAMVWVDKKEGTLNLLRNSKRPLSIANQENSFSTIYWASEPRSLWFVLGNSNQKYNIRALPEGRHYRFRLGSTTLLSDDTVPVLKKASVPAIIPASPPRQDSGRVRHIREIMQEKKAEKEAKKVTGSQTLLGEAFERASRPIPYTVKDKDGGQSKVMVQYGQKMQYVTELNTMLDMLQHGCGACGNPGDYMTDFKEGRVHFIAKDEWACHECVNTQPTAVAVLRQANATRH